MMKHIKKFMGCAAMVFTALFAFAFTATAEYVAQIGETPYETLEAAIREAQAGQTIKLLADVNIGDVYAYDKPLVCSTDNITLDLNDKTLTVPNSNAFVFSGDGATIRNGVATSGGYALKTTGAGAKITDVTVTSGGVNATAGTLEISDCTIMKPAYGAVCASGTAIVTIKSGTYSSAAKCGYWDGSDGSSPLYIWASDNNKNATINVYGGTFEGPMNLFTGYINLYGGTFYKCNTRNLNDTYPPTGLKIYGGVFDYSGNQDAYKTDRPDCMNYNKVGTANFVDSGSQVLPAEAQYRWNVVSTLDFGKLYVDDDWASKAPGTLVGADKVVGTNAFATIQAAVDAADVSAGAVTINVAEGTYDGNVVMSGKSNLIYDNSTKIGRLHFIAETGKIVTVNGAFTFENDGVQVQDICDMEFTGFTFTNGESIPIYILNSGTASKDIVIKNNTVTFSNPTSSYGVLYVLSKVVDGLTVTGNTVTGNTGYSASLGSSGGTINNATISGNTFGSYVGVFGKVLADGVTFSDNTFTGVSGGDENLWINNNTAVKSVGKITISGNAFSTAFDYPLGLNINYDEKSVIIIGAGNTYGGESITGWAETANVVISDKAAKHEALYWSDDHRLYLGTVSAFTTLAAAATAYGEAGEFTIVNYNDQMEAPEGWEFKTEGGVTKLVKKLTTYAQIGDQKYAQMADAITAVTATPVDITVVGSGNLGTKETTANEGTEFTIAGAYNIGGTEWANLGYLQLNPSKGTSATRYVLNITNSNLIVTKPQLRGSSDLYITDSHVDFAIAAGASCGYLFAFKDSAVTITNSVVGYAALDNARSTDVVAGQESTVGTSGEMKTYIYGTFSAVDSTVFTFGGDTRDDAFVICSRGLASFKNSVLYSHFIRIGKTEDRTDRDTVGREGEVATLALDNTKVIANLGEAAGLVVGDALAGKLILKNGSTVGYTTIDATVKANGTIAIDATSKITCNTISNAGVIEVDMTGATADSITLIDAAAASTYGTYQFAEGKANGYELKVVDNDLVAEKAPQPVAQVITNGGVTTNAYSTLAAAVEAAQSGDTVTLVANTAEPQIDVTKTLTIDFGAYTLSQNGDVVNGLITVKAGADDLVTLKGTTGGISAGDKFAIEMRDGGNLTIDGGVYKSDSKAALSLQSTSPRRTVTLNGGTLQSGTSAALHLSDANFVMNGGSVIGGYAYYTKAINLTRSDVKIKGGTITTTSITGSAVFWIAEGTDNVLTISGGVFSGSSTLVQNDDKTVTASITGGTFEGGISPYGSGCTVTITGGKFKNKPTAAVGAVLPAGYAAVENTTTGYFEVQRPCAAKIGETRYDTIDEALVAANALAATQSVTVELMMDVTVATNVTVVANTGNTTAFTGDYTLTLDEGVEPVLLRRQGEGNVAFGCSVSILDGNIKLGTSKGIDFAATFSGSVSVGDEDGDEEDGFIAVGTFNGSAYAMTGITGGTFNDTVEQSKISGGTFNGSVTDSKISGGTFNGSVDLQDWYKISGGTFYCLPDNADGLVSGGTFKKIANDDLEPLLTDDSAIKQTDAETLVVIPASTPKAAQVGETSYYSLYEAITKVAQDGTITLLADNSESFVAAPQDGVTKFTISGGSYKLSGTITTPEGYELKDNGDGTYSYGEKVVAVAKIGDKTYPTLKAAADEAVSGQTIELVKDYEVAATEVVEFKDGVAFNAGDYALTCAEGGSIKAIGNVKISGTKYSTDLLAGVVGTPITLTTDGLVAWGSRSCLITDGSTVTFSGNGFNFDLHDGPEGKPYDYMMIMNAAEEKNSWDASGNLNHIGITVNITDVTDAVNGFKSYALYPNANSTFNITDTQYLLAEYFNIYGGVMNVKDSNINVDQNINVTGALNIEGGTANVSYVNVYSGYEGAAGYNGGKFTAKNTTVDGQDWRMNFGGNGNRTKATYYTKGDDPSAVVTLINTTLKSSEINNTATIKLDAASKIVLMPSGEGSFTGVYNGANGVIEVDMTGATADSITLIDAAVASDYGTYQFAEGKANGYELKVVENKDLVAVKPPVAEVTHGSTVTTYADLATAFQAVKNGDTIKLLADVDLTGVEWPFISWDAADNGAVTVDGNYKTISNLTTATDTSKNAGLIAYSTGGLVVKNLTMTHVTATGQRCAGIVGQTYTAEFTNVKVLGATLCGVQKCGGLIGQALESCDLMIKNCEVKDIALDGNLNSKGGTSFGGLVGFMSKQKNVTITGCKASGISFANIRPASWYEGPEIAKDDFQFVSHPFVGALMATGEVGGEWGAYKIVLADNEVEQVPDIPRASMTNDYIGYYSNEDCTARAVAKITIDGVVIQNWAAAKIDSTKYMTLQEAFNAVQAGQTIDVLTDNTETTTVTNTCSFTLNSNGHSMGAAPTVPEGYQFVKNGNVCTYAAKPYVAQIGETKYTTYTEAFAAAANGGTVKILASDTETPANAFELLMKGDVTVTADTPMTATVAPLSKQSTVDNDGMAYIRSESDAARKIFTIGENVTLVFPYTTGDRSGAMYIGYSSTTPADVIVNGRIEAYLPYVGALSTMTISKTGSLKSISECLNVRWGSAVSVTGTDGVWTAENPQVKLGYATQQGGEVTFTDTFVDAGAWWNMQNRNGKTEYATKLTLDNTAFVADGFTGSVKGSGDTSAYEVVLENGSTLSVSGAFSVIAEGVVKIQIGSLIAAKSVDNKGKINIDATGITEPVKVIDYTGTTEMQLANFGTVNVTGGGEAYVEDNDLWIRKAPVCKIGETPYDSLAAAMEDARKATTAEGKTITILGEVAGFNFNGDNTGITLVGAEGHKITGNFGADGSYDSSLKDATFKNLNFVECGILFSYSINDMRGLTIEGCTLTYTGSTKSVPGIQWNKSQTCLADGLTIKDNVITGFTGCGIILNGYAPADNGKVVISGNTIRNGGNGFQLLNMDGLTIVSNVAENVQSMVIFNLSGATNVNIDGNVVGLIQPTAYQQYPSQVFISNANGLICIGSGNQVTNVTGELMTDMVTIIQNEAALDPYYNDQVVFVSDTTVTNEQGKITAGPIVASMANINSRVAEGLDVSFLSEATLSGLVYVKDVANKVVELAAGNVEGTITVPEDRTFTIKSDVTFTAGAEIYLPYTEGSDEFNAWVAANIPASQTANVTVYGSAEPIAQVITNGGATTKKFSDLRKALIAAKDDGSICELLGDVDLTGKAWTPLFIETRTGSDDKGYVYGTSFMGRLNGKGHTIVGLSNALFASIGSTAEDDSVPSVYDLTVSNAVLNLSKTQGLDSYGILAKEAGTDVRFSNVAIIDSTIAVSDDERVGGFVGKGYPIFADCVVSNCTISGTEQVGGFIGYAPLPGITRCAVVGTTTITATDTRAGGLVGKFQAASDEMGSDPSVISRMSENFVSCTVVSANLAGGLAGQIMGDDPRYEIKNNDINVSFDTTPEANRNPIGALRDDNDKAFDQVLAQNITGNWWEDQTLTAGSFVYQPGSGADPQTIYRGVATVVETGKCYKTLEAAVEAATEGQTINLLTDVDLSGYTRSAGTPFVLADNVTIDLKGYTISSQNYGFIFDGSGLTLTNGTFKSVGERPNYALFLGDRAGETANVGATLVDLVCNGGINVYKTSDVVIRNVVNTENVPENMFYSVWAESGSSITIESGSFTTSATDSGCLLGTYESTILVKGGLYKANGDWVALAWEGVTIMGGVFNKDPTKSVATGYEVVQNTDPATAEEYPYAVRALPNFYQDATDKSLWHVRNFAGLKEFRDSVNAGTYYRNCTIRIDDDIDMTNEGYWDSIKAYPGDLFTNTTIDGDNHTITGMTVLSPDPVSGYKYGGGFIDKASGGLTVKDLAFVRATVTSAGGSQVGIVVGMTYGNVVIDNVDLTDCHVTGVTKTGLLVGQNESPLVTVRNCDIVNSTATANYSSALLVGLLDTGSSGVFENNTVDDESKFIWMSVTGEFPDKGNLINGRYYSVDKGRLFLTDPGEKCLAEKRVSGATMTIGSTTYNVLGSVFYPEFDFAAQNGDLKYLTLEAAVAAVSTNETITVLADNSESFAVSKDYSFSIFANGHDFSGNITVASDDYEFVHDQATDTFTYQLKPNVAKVGEVEFNDLEKAVAAAKSGANKTVTLIASVDLTKYEKDACHVINADGVTLDLSGNTITVNNFGVVWQGDNMTIKNGSFVAANGGSYALFVGDERATTGVVLANLTCKGGINVYNAAVTISSTSAEGVSGTNFYAVWADAEADITIESGLFLSKGGNKAILACDAAKGLVVRGGTYSTDPTAYLASGFAVIENDDGTWKVVKAAYTITFAYFEKDIGEGKAVSSTAEPPEPMTVYNDKSWTLPAPDEYDDTNYTFVGWTDEDETYVTMQIGAGQIKASAMLYAKFSKIAKASDGGKIEVFKPGSETEKTTIVVTDEWVKDNVVEEKPTAAQINEVLETPDANGLKKWQNYVLGIETNEDGSVTAAVTSDAAQIDDANKIAVVPDVNPKAETGFEVVYQLQNLAKEIPEVTSGAIDDLQIDLTKVEKSAKFKVEVILTPVEGGSASETVVSSNTIGVLKTAAAATKSLLAVPWAGLDGRKVTIANVIKTANLTPGDKIYADNPTNTTYDSWTLSTNKTWSADKVDIINKKGKKIGERDGPAADTYQIGRGQAIWIERKDTSVPVCFYGQDVEDEKTAGELKAESVIKKPSQTETASWNLVASPKVEDLDLSVANSVTRAAVKGDQIQIPTATTPVNYTYDGKDWCYEVTRTVKIGKRTITYTELVPVTSDMKIPAGQGFWYLNKDKESEGRMIEW